MLEARKLTRADLPSAAELERLSFADPWSEKSLELLVGEMASGVCVADKDGKILAYGGIFWAPDEGQITNIAVHPDCRRQGLGRTVTLALLEAARQKHCQTAVLEVRESNLAAITLYESLGFSKVGTRKNFYKNPRENASLYAFSLES